MKILFIGDIVGRPGRNAVKALLPELKEAYKPDLIFANGENVAAGQGFTYDKYQELRAVGIDYFTTGNHIWAKKEFMPYLDDPAINVIRPANYPKNLPGRGWAIIEHNGIKIQLINLVGKAFMHGEIDDYFAAVDEILSSTQADIRIIDFHAEATSEKVILAYYLDGRVTALFGTHTHVPTADERILPKGTAFQTDLGMTGPLHSTLGAKLESYLHAAKTGEPAKYEVATGPVVFNATLLTLNDTNQVTAIERLQRMYDN
jgi:2',3'-cyclic-nucleotide 2'-phosphodiesterase